MIHVRVVSPSQVTGDLLTMLDSDAGVLNLTVVPASARKPEGDAVQFDLTPARANEVIHRLRGLDLDQHGSISLEPVTPVMSRAGSDLPAPHSRFDDLAPVWEEVEARIRSGARFPPSWYALLVIAGLIGVVGLVTNSQILIVGAMVVGPEYGAIVGLAFGATRGDHALARRSLFALTAGFAAAIVAALLFGLVIRAGGLAPNAFSAGVRPVSNLIDSPDWFSVIVAVLAGMVGVISLTEARASTLIGVFISVTTIPAAADVGVSLAFGAGQEALGSVEQLLLNIAILSVVAAVGIPAQRAAWGRLTRNSVGTEVR